MTGFKSIWDHQEKSGKWNGKALMEIGGLATGGELWERHFKIPF